MFFRRGLALFAFLWLFMMLSPASVQARADGQRHSLHFAGAMRDYLVHLPPSYKSGGAKLPVVLALHGGGGSAAQMETGYGLDPYADRAGMIIVYPEGVPATLSKKIHTWNAGLCCGKAQKINSDDTGFLSAVIDAVVHEYGADARHVFVTGHSNGAQMAYRLSCELSGKISAIAPVNGQSFDCPHLTPVAVLHIHGTLDQCIPYGGSSSCGGCFSNVIGLPLGDSDHWPCPSVEASLSARAAAYGCEQTTKITHRGGSVSCAAWNSCPSLAGVTLCRIEGGGHTWQGSAPPSFCTRKPDGHFCRKWSESIGPILPDVDINGVIFDFFTTQARP